MLAYGKTLLGHFTSCCALSTQKASLGCRHSEKSPPFGHTQTFFFFLITGKAFFRNAMPFFFFNYKNKKNGVETFSGPGKREGKKGDREFG